MRGSKLVLRITAAAIFAAPISAWTQALPGVYPDSESAGRPDTKQFIEETTKSQVEQTLVVDPSGTPVSGMYLAQEPKVKEALDRMQKNIESGASPDRHLYDMGAPQSEVDKNWNEDYYRTLQYDEFLKCMDYRIVGVWTKLFIETGDLAFIPYVKYYGPPQKVESVDHPFKSGYFTKEEMLEKRAEIDSQAYYDIADRIAELNMQITSAATALQFGTKYEFPDYGADKMDHIRKARDDLKRNYSPDERYHTLDGSGYVYNEYRVMETGIDVAEYPARGLAETDPGVVEAAILTTMADEMCRKNGVGTVPYDPSFVHNLPPRPKPQTFASDDPENILFSRSLIESFKQFPVEMGILTFMPTVCQIFNRNKSWREKDESLKGMEAVSAGRKKNFDPKTTQDQPDNEVPGYDAFFGTPADMLLGLNIPDINIPEYLCQGMNQGSWLPLLNTVKSAYHTTAAAIGTVRGIQASAKKFEGVNHPFAYDNPDILMSAPPEDWDPTIDGDKVQWLRSEFMDGHPNQAGNEGRQCQSIEKWVMKYGLGNMKFKNESGDPQEAPEDHWHVVNHWRYWRGEIDPCPGGEGQKWIWLDRSNPQPQTVDIRF